MNPKFSETTPNSLVEWNGTSYSDWRFQNRWSIILPPIVILSFVVLLRRPASKSWTRFVTSFVSRKPCLKQYRNWLDFCSGTRKHGWVFLACVLWAEDMAVCWLTLDFLGKSVILAEEKRTLCESMIVSHIDSVGQCSSWAAISRSMATQLTRGHLRCNGRNWTIYSHQIDCRRWRWEPKINF